MKKEFVSYEIALKLKELGFDEECCALYRHEHLFNTLGFEKINSAKQSVISAPLWQQAEQWFREKYNLHITITSQSQESWQWHIQFPHDSLNKMWEEDFYTYEEAREQAILKAIELCQKEN